MVPSARPSDSMSCGRGRRRGVAGRRLATFGRPDSAGAGGVPETPGPLRIRVPPTHAEVPRRRGTSCWLPELSAGSGNFLLAPGSFRRLTELSQASRKLPKPHGNSQASRKFPKPSGSSPSLRGISQASGKSPKPQGNLPSLREISQAFGKFPTSQASFPSLLRRPAHAGRRRFSRTLWRGEDSRPVPSRRFSRPALWPKEQRKREVVRGHSRAGARRVSSDLYSSVSSVADWFLAADASRPN
jgi:hypothetical protein